MDDTCQISTTYLKSPFEVNIEKCIKQKHDMLWTHSWRSIKPNNLRPSNENSILLDLYTSCHVLKVVIFYPLS